MHLAKLIIPQDQLIKNKTKEIKMNYNFETFKDRRGTGAAKYRLMFIQNPQVEEGIVPMATADMEINTPQAITRGLIDYIDGGILGYETVTDAYLEAVKGWFSRRYGWEIEKEWICPSPGVVAGFYGALRALSEEGDGVIVTPPVYGPFYSAIEDTKRRLVECRLIDREGRYELDFEALENLAKDPENKVLMFCNPHNPSGRVWTREELEKVGKICLDNGLYIISDEIHADFVRPEYKFTSFGNVSKEISDITIVCSAPNKTFNIAGLQGGNNIISNKELKARFDQEAARTKTGATNSMALKATEIAYTECDQWVDELTSLIYKNIDDFISLMEEHMPMVKTYRPEGTYLVWMDMAGLGMDDEALEDFLHKDAQLFLNQGSFFKHDKPCYRRINLACPNYLVEDTVLRLKKAFESRGD